MPTSPNAPDRSTWPDGGDGVLPTVGGGGIRHEVVDILRQAIWDGRLEPGQRLNEQLMARDLGVSRPPLREAIRVLEQEGLVTSQPRRGTFVTNLTGDDIMEIYVVRCALECAAAEYLAAEASSEFLDLLEDHVDAPIPAEWGIAEIVDHDLEFHRRLVNACGNARLTQMWEQLASQLHLALIRADPAFFESEFVDATHRELINGMRSGDLDLVRAAVMRLLDVGESLRTQWNAEPDPTE